MVKYKWSPQGMRAAQPKETDGGIYYKLTDIDGYLEAVQKELLATKEDNDALKLENIALRECIAVLQSEAFQKMLIEATQAYIEQRIKGNAKEEPRGIFQELSRG